MAEHKLRALVSGLSPFFFNKTRDNTIEGHTYPDEASTLDLGSATKPFRAIYADSLLGSGGGSLDQLVRVSSADSTSGYLEDKIAGVSPISLATSTDSLINISLNTSTLLLRDGSNSLTGNLSVASSITIDGVDIGNPLGTLLISSTRLGVNQASDFTWTGTHQFNVDPQINANLDFIGGARTITSSSDLTIDPSGTLYYPLAQNIQAVGFQDLVSGIDGFKHHNPSGNTRQLTIGRIKADELYVRIFTADEERVNRGAEFWARSFGIVETTFTVPADESNVDVYFEEVPGLPGAKLFLPNNWILFRTVDVDTGLTVMTVWFQVVDAGANDYVSRADANESTGRLAYQVWRLKRKSGGTTGVEIKKGNVGVDFGLPADAVGTPLTGQYEGQGVVALSALSQDSGPYIQIQTFDTVTTDTPVFLNRVRMGNLNGVLGYDRDVDGELFGFAAGNNLALDPDAGSFKGVVIDQVNGLRMYNTEIKLFDGADDTVYLNPTLGLGFQLDVSEFDNDRLYVSWYSDLADSLTWAAPVGRIGAWGDAVDGTFGLNSFGTDVSRIRLNAVGNSGAVDSTLIVSAGDSVISSFVEIISPVFRTRGTNVKTMIGATSTSDSPISRLHVYDNTTDTGEAGGVIIEQKGTGDSMLHWYTGNITGQWFTAGIDKNDGGKWKLTASNFLDNGSAVPSIIINPSDGSVIINGLDLSGGTPITGLTSTDGSITITANNLAVNPAMYVRTTTQIVTNSGSGLSGGDDLGGNITLAVNFSEVVSTSVAVNSGAGLTGGGTLTTTRTLAVGAGLGITVNADDVQINFGYSPTWTGIHTFDQDVQVNADLDFIGGNRQITGSNSITMAPTNDLTFTPGDAVILTTAKVFKSSDYNPTSTGITGFAFITNGAGNKQLDIDTIRADQLRAETFVADATRVDIGEEYWGKSMGIINANLTTPSSIGGTTFIYFEDSAALQDTALFSNNDWILIRTVTNAGAINEFWGQVSSYTDQGTDSNGKKYQRWTFTLRAGPTSTVIKSGNVAVGFGAAGQGYVHLTTLSSDNGPFIEIGKWGGSNPYDGVSDTTNVRMGNLNGAAGIATNEWGFATGNNLALTPSTGFSGVVSSATDGVLIYNSDLIIYDSGVEVTSLTQSLGLTLTLADSLTHGDGSGQPSTINWINVDDHSAWISSGLETSTHTIMDIATFNNDSLGTSEIRISSYGHGGDIIGFPLLSNSHSNIRISSEDEGYIFLGAMKTITHGSLSVGLPVSPDVQGTLTVPSTAEATLYVNAATAGAGYFDTNYPGVLINRGELRFEVAGSTFVTVGIDDADGDKFKISYADDFSTAFITFNPITGVTTISGLDGTAALDGVTAGTGIVIAGAEIAVNSSVVRTTRYINTGSGLSGGGDLSSDLTLTIDTGVVVINTRTLTAGNGLTGGGDLTADRTFNVGAGSGITVNANDIEINLAATSGLNLTSGLALDDSTAGAGLVIASKVLAVGAGSGITVNANDVAINLAATSGLNLTSGLALDDSTAGAGLTIASKVLAVGAGDGITVNANDIAVDTTVVRTTRLITSGAGLTGGGDLSADRTLAVGAGAGITVNADDVAINLATNSGLNVGAGLAVDASIAGAALTLTTGVLDVVVTSTGGLEIATDSLKIKLPANSGLTTDSTGLYLPSSLAGTGLSLTTGVLSVNTASGITTSGDNIILDSATAGAGLAYSTGVLSVNVASGIAISGDNVILDSAAAGAGLTYTTGVLAVVATNTSITVGTNDLAVNFNHAFTWTAAHIWNSSTTFNSDPQVSANLDFIGGSRTITTASSDNLTVSPGGDLILDPTGNITIPNAQEFKTSTFTDAVTGIVGFRMWDRGSNYRQLTTGAIKVDELFARVFVADETRIDRGEEYWSKSYGVVDQDFTLPADEASVDVWFENATGIGTGNIFSAGDYLLCRAIDWDTGIAIVKVWFTVTTLLTAGSVDGFTQQWRLKRESGGTTGLVIKKGIVILDVGQIGQGQIHLSALDQDGGPFIQIGEFTSVVSSDTPLFTNYVRMGNLNGTVDYASDTWGFVAGKNIGTSIAGGFSGLTLESTNGLRLFNTEFVIYESGTKVASFGEDSGVIFKYDSTAFSGPTRGMYWGDSVPSPTSTTLTFLNGYRDGTGNHLFMGTRNTGDTEVRITSSNSTSGNDSYLYLYDESIYLGVNETGAIYFDGTNIQLGYLAVGGTATDSRVHIFENTSANNASTGLTIENANSAGDSAIHFLHGSGTTQRWSMGTDRSDSNKFKISETAGFGSLNHLTITPSTGLINIAGNLTMVTGTTLTVETIRAVDATGLIFADDSGTGYAFLEDGGNFGIGTAASNPVTTLDVRGNSLWVNGSGASALSSGAGSGIRISSTSIFSYDYSTSTPNTLTLQSPGGAVAITGAATVGSTLNVTGAATFNDDIIFSPGSTQNYVWSDDGAGVLLLQSSLSGGSNVLRMYTADGDGTDNVGIQLWGKGKSGNTSNRERLILQYASTQMEIFSEAEGTGTLRPLVLYTEGNTNQLYLNVLGKVGINTSGSANSFALSVAAPGVSPEASAVISANAGVVGIFGDGHSFFMARDVTNNREAIFGTSSGGGIAGTMTAHTFTIRTSNTDRLTFAAASNDATFAGLVTATGINVGEDTLTVYDEGTWTVTLSGSTVPTVTYTTRHGTYQRINAAYHLQASATIATRSGGGGVARFALPATSFATGYQVLSAKFYDVSAGSEYPAVLEVGASLAYGVLYVGNTAILSTAIDAGDIITYSGILFT